MLVVRREPRRLAALWLVEGGGLHFLVAGAVGFTAGAGLSLALVAVLVIGSMLGYFVFFKAGAQAAPATPSIRSRQPAVLRPAITPTPRPAPTAQPVLPAASDTPAHLFFSIEVIERDLAGIGALTPGPTGVPEPAGEPVVTPAPLRGWPVTGHISQVFGCSRYYTGRVGPDCPAAAPWFHDGVDIAARMGAPVRAALGGTVIFAGADGSGPVCQEGDQGYGLAVVIDDGAGWQALYAHLSQVEVEPGQRVWPDTVIGRVGDTGCVSGVHLHFGLQHNGILLDPEIVAGPRQNQEE